MAPVVGMNEVLRIGSANHRKRYAEHRHGPKGNQFLSHVTASSLAPGPTPVERIRGDGTDDVADERRFDFALDDLEPVDEGNDDN